MIVLHCDNFVFQNTKSEVTLKKSALKKPDVVFGGLVFPVVIPVTNHWNGQDKMA